MKGIDGSFVPGVGNVKDRAGRIDGLKNRSGKCEGPGRGGATPERTKQGNTKDRPGGLTS